MLQTTTNINVDFYDKRYILINAKQFDKKSRYLSLTCYNHGEPVSLNEGEHSAYIRYRKADNNSVFNFCEIDRTGKIKVELTEQMLATDGICCADLVIVNEGGAKVDAQTGEIIGIENSSILSTMPLHIDVTVTAVENSNIESSYEFNGLNTALEKAEAEYTEVMKTSKSWAVGGTGIRDGEDTNNSKYWSEQSKKSANASSTSATKAATSEANAKDYMDNALTYSQNAEAYMNSAEDYKDEAFDSATASANSASASADSQEKAKASEDAAKGSEDKAKVSENKALDSENKAKSSEEKALVSEQNAKTSETNALNSANRAQSYAVGGTGTREGEDTDNSYYYCERVKSIVNGLDSGFIPMGTISFSELATIEKLTGYVYNIRDDFVTDESFREGAGRSYTAGVNVYYTASGLWDAFGGASSPTATVDEVKNYLGI